MSRKVDCYVTGFELSSVIGSSVLISFWADEHPVIRTSRLTTIAPMNMLNRLFCLLSYMISDSPTSKTLLHTNTMS